MHSDGVPIVVSFTAVKWQHVIQLCLHAVSQLHSILRYTPADGSEATGEVTNHPGSAVASALRLLLLPFARAGWPAGKS